MLCLRKIRVLHVLAFFETASTWWFQDILLLIFMPRCFAVLCRALFSRMGRPLSMYSFLFYIDLGL